MIGEQLPDFSPHFMQKGGSAQSAKMQKQVPSHHQKTGLSSNVPVDLEQPFVGMPANCKQDTRNGPPSVQPSIRTPDVSSMSVSSVCCITVALLPKYSCFLKIDVLFPLNT